MKCEAFNEKIIDLVDGTIFGTEREQALIHLKSCPLCSELFTSYTELKNELSSIEVPMPPQEYFDESARSIMSKCLTGDKPRARGIVAHIGTFLISRRSAAFASLALLLALVFMMWPGADRLKVDIHPDDLTYYRDAEYEIALADNADIEVLGSQYLYSFLEQTIEDSGSEDGIENYLASNTAEYTYNGYGLSADLDLFDENEFQDLLAMMKEI